MNVKAVTDSVARTLIKLHQLKKTALFLTLTAAVVAAAGFIFSSPVLPDSATARNIQFALSLLNGQGLSAPALYPFEIAQLNFLSLCPASSVMSSCLLAAGAILNSDIMKGTALINLCFYVLTVPFLYALTKTTFSKAAALCACIIYILNPATLNTALSGSACVPAAAFLVLTTLIILQGEKRQHFFLAGTAFGVAFACSFYTATALPALLCVIAMRNIKIRRLELCLAFVLPPALIIFALMLFSGALTKQNTALWPAALLSDTEFFPGHSIFRYLKNPDSFLCAFMNSGFAGNMMEDKFRLMLNLLIRNMAVLFGACLIMFVPAVLETVIPEKTKAKPVKLFFVLFTLGSVLAMGLTAPSVSAAYVICPFVTVCGAAFLVRLAKRLAPVAAPKEQQSLYLAGLCSVVIVLNFVLPSTPKAPDFRQIAGAIEKELPSPAPETKTAMSLSPDLLPVAGFIKNGSLICFSAPRNPSMLDELKKQNIYTDIIVFSLKAEEKENPEWKLFFKRHAKRVRTIKTDSKEIHIYTTDSRGLSQTTEKQSDAEGTEPSERLALLGNALNINPGNYSARKKLSALRRQLYPEGLRHETRARLMLRETEKTLRAFQNFIIAAGFKDNIRSAELGLRAARMKEVFTLVRHKAEKMYLGTVPAPDTLGDGKYMQETDGFECYKPKLKIDLGRPRQVDALIIKARISGRKNISRLELSTSVDGWNWRPAKTSVPGKNPAGLNIISIKDLGLFTRFIMLGIDGDELSEQSVAEVEVWGYSPKNETPAPDVPQSRPWTVKEYRNASNMHRDTGKVIKDNDSSATDFLAVSARSGQDRKGLVAFGGDVRVEPGRYLMTFSVKTDTTGLSPDTDMFLMNASDASGRKKIVSRTLKVKDLKAGTGFNVYTLNFEIKKSVFVEPRLYFNGNGTVTCDRISIKGIAYPARAVWCSTPEGGFVPDTEEVEDFLSEDEKQAIKLIALNRT